MHSDSIPHAEYVPVRTVVGVVNFPEAIRSLDTYESPDYADLFTVSTGVDSDCSGEDWARLILEETTTGRSAPVLWRLLGLRLGPTPSTTHIQGWKIADQGHEWVRIETASWFISAHAIVRIDDGQVSLALFVRYDHRVANVIWPPVARLHRKGAAVMVRQAVTAHKARALEITRKP